jgi:hypothetical protein
LSELLGDGENCLVSSVTTTMMTVAGATAIRGIVERIETRGHARAWTLLRRRKKQANNCAKKRHAPNYEGLKNFLKRGEVRALRHNDGRDGVYADYREGDPN